MSWVDWQGKKHPDSEAYWQGFDGKKHPMSDNPLQGVLGMLGSIASADPIGDWTAKGIQDIFGTWGNQAQQQQNEALTAAINKKKAVAQAAQPAAPADGSSLQDLIGQASSTAAAAQAAADAEAAKATTASQDVQYTTPDGHILTAGTDDYSFYNAIDMLWQQEYGKHVSWSIVDAMRNAGIKTGEQISIAIDNMPSAIPDKTLGEFNRVKNTAQKYADKYFGRPIPESLVHEFFSQNITSPDQIQLWFLNHPASAMPKEMYQGIFDMANQWTNGVHNTVPHPTQIAAIHQSASQPGQSAPAAAPAPSVVPPLPQVTPDQSTAFYPPLPGVTPDQSTTNLPEQAVDNPELAAKVHAQVR